MPQNMQIDNTENSYIGTVISILLAVFTFADIETWAKIVASIAATIAACTTIYLQFKNNRKK